MRNYLVVNGWRTEFLDLNKQKSSELHILHIRRLEHALADLQERLGITELFKEEPTPTEGDPL